MWERNRNANAAPQLDLALGGPPRPVGAAPGWPLLHARRLPQRRCRRNFCVITAAGMLLLLMLILLKRLGTALRSVGVKQILRNRNKNNKNVRALLEYI